MSADASFASDNAAPVAPEVLEAIRAANDGAAEGYGHDRWTAEAVARFREHFGQRTAVYFTFNGTGANVVALASLLRPWESVLCAASAHLQTDECGALERFAGCKVVPIVSDDGKLRPEGIEPHLGLKDEEHHAQPRVISISQPTEYGLLYTPGEVTALCRFAHERGLLVHVDGARIANAAAALRSTPREITADLGVDALSFGGTKNGALGGEAVCFFSDAVLAAAPVFTRKQAMQLASKMRFVAVQLAALLAGDRWRTHAAHANEMARRLRDRVSEIPGIRLTRPVDCNAVFATLDRAARDRLLREYFFYTFDDALPEVRWMTHWATTREQVDAFGSAVERAVS